VIEQILRRPVSVIVATVAVAALGVFSLVKLPLSLLPAIDRPALKIVARADASSRDEMLHEVTAPIERRLSSVPGVASIESETLDGESRIVIGSAWQTDPDRLRIDVARRIEGAAPNLDTLEITTETSESPVIEVAVTGSTGAARTRVAERVLLPELARIEGAGRIELAGATPLRPVVQPRAADLAARGLTAADIEQRLRSVGRSMAAGRVRDGSAVRPVVVSQPTRSLDELRGVLVGGVALGELANVGLREVGDDTFFWTGGKELAPAEGVLLRVHRAPSANAVALAREVRNCVADLGARVPGVTISVVADRSREVTRALTELALSALLGVLLGTFVLRFMLGHWRPTLALSVVIPVALLASFTAFFAAGIPLDVISLAGLALATGLLVDNSIVVLESIETARASGRRDAVSAGTKQIVLAVVASSITLMIVFAPLLYLRGLARAIFGEQAIAVVASVAASLVLSLTLTPVLAQRDKPGDAKPRNPGLDRYLALLGRVMRHPAPALLAGLVTVALGLAAGLLLPRELFSRGAERHVSIEVMLPSQLHPDAARAELRRVWSAAASQKPDAITATFTGDGEAELDLTFATPRVARTAAEELRASVSSLAGLRANVRIRPSAFIEAVGGDADRVEMIVSAATDGEAVALANRATKTMSDRGFRLMDDPALRAKPAMVVRWDERRLATNGITRAAAERDVRAALGDIDAGQVDIRGAEPEVRLLPTLPRELGVLPVRIAQARVVPLAGVAGARIGESTPLAMHDQGRPARRLAFVSPGTQPDASWLALRGTERVRFAGHARELGEAFAQMRLALILAAILLYLTVAAFYESLVLPLLVMLALPFAGAGAIVALLVTGQSLNIMSLIGLVFLAGVVVNHTVVLLDRAEQLRSAGVDEDEAVRRAAADRFRPVIMTTATAILGMLPLAVLGGDGVELRRAVGIAVIGGLITATLGTLVLIPLLHRLIEPYRRRRTHVIPSVARDLGGKVRELATSEAQVA
jgi:HAE1 family hydrophobic/amphiphilic exporter-1